MDKNKLTTLLDELDKELILMRERDIVKKLNALFKSEDKAKPPIEYIWETMAFDFSEDCKKKETGWGTYFGPMFVLSKDDGSVTERPSIQQIT